MNGTSKTAAFFIIARLIGEALAHRRISLLFGSISMGEMDISYNQKSAEGGNRGRR